MRNVPEKTVEETLMVYCKGLVAVVFLERAE
jgi:hypothetical protein